ncbi:MAG: response regulator [Gemmatimonadales bacterium]|nr:response regulator [Gemmatimonadales bacterium]
MADPTQIDQVLINLVGNARDALSPGGQVSISITGVELDASYALAHGGVELVPGPFVCLSVADNGRGMDRATVAKIFEPFFTTKPMGQGSGLGLSMVYGIVKQHGGFVWAYSEPDFGTTIKVYLPAAVAEPAVRAPAESAARGTGCVGETGARVLVVEDEPVVRALVVRSLQAAGYQTLEAGDGAEALAVVRREQGRPDLVLTDVVMPAMNGRELGEALARLHVHLPVLYMSGYAVDDVRQRGLVPIGAPFVQKPFSPDGLVDQVRALLNGGNGRA